MTTGFGPFDHGSQLPSQPLSSSTLSPLAPPFTVDRPAPQSAPPPFTIDRLAPQSASSPRVFEDPYENWLHLHPPTSNSNPIPPPNPEIIPIGTGFGCFGPQPIVSQAAHLPLNRPFNAFGQPQVLPKGSLLEAEPYYPRYSSAFYDKNGMISGGIPFGASNSAVSPSEGFFGKSSSAFGQMAKGKGLWEDYLSSNPSQLGGPAVVGFAVPEEDSCVWHKKSVESLANKAHIGSKCTGSELLDAAYTAFLQENSSPFKAPASSVLVQGSALQEVSYSQTSEPDPTKAWNPFKLNKNPHNCLAKHDSCATGLTFCPARKFPSPSQSLETGTSKNVLNGDQTADAHSNNDSSVGCNFSTVNAGGYEVNADTGGTSNEKDKNYHKFSGFPTMKTELPLDLRPVRSLRCPLEEKSGSKVTQLSGFEAFPSAPDTAGPGDSIGSSLKMMDQFLPPVDSPCWKGAPLPQCSSPFRVVEAPVHLPLMKGSEGCSDLNKQNQLLPDNVNNADYLSLKSPENSAYSESGCEKKGLPYFESECEKKGPSSFYLKPTSTTCQYSVDADKIGSDFFNFGKGWGIQAYLAIQESRSESSSELEASDVKTSSPEKDVTYATKPIPESRIADPGTDFCKEAQNDPSDFLSHAREHASNVSFSGVSFSTESVDENEVSDASSESGDENEVSDASSDLSPPRLDTQIAVKMIHYLSELLLSEHHGDGHTLKENDYGVLQLVINNLNACALNKVGLMRQIHAGSSSCLRKSTDPREGTIMGGSPFTGRKADHILSQSDQSILNKGSLHAWNKKADKFQNRYSTDDMAFEKDNEMSQAIKKVMNENIQEQGEDPQTLLFKNLWIEAEAALCSMKYELRLAQMKLEKCKQHQATVNSIGVATDSHCSLGTAAEKSPNSIAIGDSDGDDTPTPKFNEISTGKKVINTPAADDREGSYTNPQEVKQPSAADEANNLESSVMARFKILQTRVENLSSTCNAVPKQQTYIIGNGEGHGLVPRQWCLERQLDAAMEDTPTNVVDGGFTEEREARPFIINQMEGGNSEVGNGLVVERDVQSSSNCFHPDVSKQFEVSESDARVADELVSELLGNQVSLGGYDSPSSDWEHVLKEELTL